MPASAWLCGCDHQNFEQGSKVSPAFWEMRTLFRVGEESRRGGGGLSLPCQRTVAGFIFFECDVHFERVRPNPPYSLCEWCMSSRITPKQPGAGQKCSTAGRTCPPLNICAPKPHQRWVPRFAPSPLVSRRSCLGGGQPDRARLNTPFGFTPSPLVSMRLYLGCRSCLLKCG